MREHPWIAISIIFLGLITAGTIIGYMSVNIPEELTRIPEVLNPPQEEFVIPHQAYLVFNTSPPDCDTPYCSHNKARHIVDYTISDDAVITNVVYSLNGSKQEQP